MDVRRVRKDFPILEGKTEGRTMVYLDSACQSLRPRQVVESLLHYYEDHPACAGRSVHSLATKVSIAVDEARERLSGYCGAGDERQVVFTKNCTEALNTVIFGIGLGKNDRVLATDREHNSVHVPLMKLKEGVGIEYAHVRSSGDETFDIEAFKKAMGKRTKLVAMCHTSNVNGATIPAKEVCEIAHDRGAKVLLDGAQYAPYGDFDLTKIGVDFYAFSMHKMCGPAGLGVLVGKIDLLEKVVPLTFGGHGISVSTRERIELLGAPEKFEVGLQDYAGIEAAGAAAEYLRAIGREDISGHVCKLNARATKDLLAIEGASLIRPADANQRSGIMSFNLEGRTPHDIAMMLDERDRIMIRSGMHCAHSWFEDRGIPGSARASFYIYNDEGDVERFSAALRELAR